MIPHEGGAMKLDLWKEIFSLLDAGGECRNSHYYAAYDNDGRVHREGGPAIIYLNGVLEWRQHGRLHRKDGPALIYPDGQKYWYRNGQVVLADPGYPNKN
jgi:hypothetical protein